MPTTNINESLGDFRGNTYEYQFLKNWVRTPRYRQLVAQGKLLPENDFSYQWRLARAPLTRIFDGAPKDRTFLGWYGSSSNLNAYAVLNNDGVFNAPTRHSATERWTNSVLSRAIVEKLAENRLSKKLNNRDIDLGVALGEARETAHFIQGAMLSCFVAAKRARRGDLSGVLKALGLSANSDPKMQRFRDVPDKVSGAWMAYSYGVRPLLADVFGACKALEKRHERPTIMTYRATELCELDFELQTPSVLQDGTIDPSYFMKVKGFHKASSKMTFQVDDFLLYKLSELGLTNPLAVAHELITLSFVVDWFIPIGAWINGLVPPQGVSNVRRTTTWSGEVAFNGYIDFNKKVGSTQMSGRPPVGATNRWKVRTVKSGFPRFHLVGANFDLSKQQVASGLSLLWMFGAGEKSQAKAYNDAVALNSRGYANTSTANLSREAWTHGRRNVKSASGPGYLFPSSFAHI